MAGESTACVYGDDDETGEMDEMERGEGVPSPTKICEEGCEGCKDPTSKVESSNLEYAPG